MRHLHTYSEWCYGKQDREDGGIKSTSVTKERNRIALCSLQRSVVSVCDAQVDYVNAAYNRTAVSDCVSAL